MITTQLSDEPGVFEADASSTLIIPPIEAGMEIHIEEETIEELKRSLVQDGGFSNDDAESIASQFNLPSA